MALESIGTAPSDSRFGSSSVGVATDEINEFTSAAGVTIDGVLLKDNGITATGTLTFGGTALAATTAEINRTCDVSGRLVAAGSALTVTEALHDGKTILLDTAAGSTCTLPAATGSGARFRFVIKTLATSNSHIIKVADATDVMYGFALVAQDAGDTSVLFETAADSDTITLNRTTTGSTQKGEFFELEDIDTNVWSVFGVIAATGTEASPFSATVA